ncbi:MAG: cadherin repeat domain-containing protein [Cytophagales bacterium]|nr:cadherin repeat domain-containing protein [Cytophagales bacterium]
MKRHYIFKVTLFALIFLWGSRQTATAQTIDPRAKDAVFQLFDHMGGANWKRNNNRQTLWNQAKNNTHSPKITVNGRSSGKGKQIDLFDFSNNGLAGDMPESVFLYTADEYSDTPKPWMKCPSRFRQNNKKFDLGHNSITSIPSQIIYINCGQPHNVYLDHNKLTKFTAKPNKHNDFYQSFGFNGVLDISNNEIERISKSDIRHKDETGIGAYNAIGSGIKHIDISNNRMNFTSIIEFSNLAVSGANQSRLSWKKTFNKHEDSIRCFPQKPLGSIVPKVEKNAGESHTLSFSLPHRDNVYHWALNGKEVPLSEGKEYTVEGISESKAGIYNCWITNPAYPGKRLESKDFEVWLSKTGNHAPSDLNLSVNKAVVGTKPMSIVGEFSGTDPDNDAVYYRLLEDPKYPDNYSFKIQNGNTLISSEDLFDRPTISEYKIFVEA